MDSSIILAGTLLGLFLVLAIANRCVRMRRTCDFRFYYKRGSMADRTCTWCGHVWLELTNRKLLSGPPSFNPARSEIVMHVIYWFVLVLYDLCPGPSSAVVASKTAKGAIIHLAPLLATSNLHFLSNILGYDLRVTTRWHGAFGVIALIQSVAHGIVMVGQGNINKLSSGLLVRHLAPSTNVTR